MSCDVVPLSSSFQRLKKPPTGGVVGVGGDSTNPGGGGTAAVILVEYHHQEAGTRSLPHGFTYVPDKATTTTSSSGDQCQHVTVRNGVPTSRTTSSNRNSWIGSLWDIFALPIKAWLGPSGGLYYQPRRSFYSPSGYDIDTGGGAGTTTPTAAMFGGRDPLSGRRELVEQLDSEPLFDYLVQNGALELPMVDELRNEKSAAKVNLALLKHVETNGKPALNLFINALRQTGQHHLASLLDDTQRIKALSGSGYLSQKRHKGQISLQINVRALRLPLEELSLLRGRATSERSTPLRKNASFRSNGSGLGSARDWVSLDEIRYRILELTEPSVVPPVPQFELADPNDDDGQSKRSCLCACFARMFSRRKGLPDSQQRQQVAPSQGSHHTSNNIKARQEQQQVQRRNHSNNGGQNGYTPSGVSGKYTPRDKNSIYQVTNNGSSTYGNGQDGDEQETAKEKELRGLRGLENRFNDIARQFFGVVKDLPAVSAHLSKYFEQDRGVLVLETNFELSSGLVIVSICMKQEQVEQLRRDYSNGKLNKDLENCLITDSILDKVGVKGIKLHTDINQDEFELAEQELN